MHEHSGSDVWLKTVTGLNEDSVHSRALQKRASGSKNESLGGLPAMRKLQRRRVSSESSLKATQQARAQEPAGRQAPPVIFANLPRHPAETFRPARPLQIPASFFPQQSNRPLPTPSGPGQSRVGLRCPAARDQDVRPGS